MPLIDQQEALDALNAQADEMSHWHEGYAEQRKGILTAVNIVSDIKPKRGKWIHHEGGYSDHYECTACGKAIVLTGRWNFCPNCGADMRGEADGQN